MTDTIDKSNLPTSFGSFKPVGHVMLGLPNAEQAAALATALAEAGWAKEKLVPFRPRESVEEMQALIDNASGLAGFGYEITLMRRYLELSKDGCRWLLVSVDNLEEATEAADLARPMGATLAVYYRTLSVEELI